MTGTPANLDRLLHAWQARITGGVAPTSLTLALLDWAVHLAGSPGAQQRLADKAVRQAGRLAAHVAERWRDPAAPACIEPLPQDHRFDGPRVAAVAVRHPRAGIPAIAAVVAQRHDRRAWPFEAP